MKEYRFKPTVTLNHNSLVPLRLQIIKQIRQAVIDNRVPPGTRFISERQMAKNLAVNRDTVHQAYLELISDGLLESLSSHGGPRIAASVLKIYEMSFPCINFLLPYTFGEHMTMNEKNKNMLWLEYVGGVLDRASQCGISVNILALPSPSASEEQINEWVKRFISRSIGTIILGSRDIDFDPVFEALTCCRKVPHVFLNGRGNHDNISTVTADISAGINAMLEQFKRQKVNDIGLVYFEKKEYSGQFHYVSGNRVKEVEDCAQKKGFHIRKYEIRGDSFSPEKKAKILVDQLVSESSPPRALWCYNDLTALSVLKELESRKLHVPDDFLLVGYDNSVPEDVGLSSVAHSREALGKTAVDLLLEMLGSSDSPKVKHKTLPTTFYPRKTTGFPETPSHL